MRQVLLLIFACLVMVQPNAQTRESSALITMAQFACLVLVALVRDKPK